MHQIGELLSDLFFHTGQAVKESNFQSVYSIDSLPNIRIANSRIIRGKGYREHYVFKRYWFYGFKVHMLVTSGGIPVEFFFTARSKHDLDGLSNLSEGSDVLADSAYTDYLMEEMPVENGTR